MSVQHPVRHAAAWRTAHGHRVKRWNQETVGTSIQKELLLPYQQLAREEMFCTDRHLGCATTTCTHLHSAHYHRQQQQEISPYINTSLAHRHVFHQRMLLVALQLCSHALHGMQDLLLCCCQLLKLQLARYLSFTKCHLQLKHSLGRGLLGRLQQVHLCGEPIHLHALALSRSYEICIAWGLCNGEKQCYYPRGVVCNTKAAA